MSDIVLAGDAPLVAHVITGTLDSYDTGTTYAVTINGRSISTIGTGGTTSTTATALRALLNAATAPPEFQAITWSGATNAIIGTSDTTGKQIIAALSATGGTGAVTDFTNTTANSGPEAVVAANFRNASTLARALPVDADTLYIYNFDGNLNQNLENLAAIDLAALHIKASFEGTIGLPYTNEDDSEDTYAEHRTRYLKINGATKGYIGEGDGDGSARIMLDLQAIASNILVVKTSQSEDDLHALIIKGTEATNVLKVEGGTVDIAPFAGEVSTFATLTVTNDATVRTWPGVTLATVNADGDATILINSAAALTDITTINIRENAVVTLRGDNAVGTVNIDGAQAILDLQSSGTITAMNLYEGATLDVDSNPTGVTVTTITVYGSCTINDRNGKLTVTNAITNFSQVTFNGQPKRAHTLGAP